MSATDDPVIVSREAWLIARKELLAKEKAFTRARDQLSRDRRALPWVQLEKPYEFDTTGGRRSLADLFGSKRQLIVYHFMFGPDWQEGCPSCSFWADNYNGTTAHLAQRDTAFVTISRAPLEQLQRYRQRMGWQFEWVSSLDSDFNRDFEVSFTGEEIESGNNCYNYETGSARLQELPGLSAFYRDDAGIVYHTYSCYARGLDMLNSAYHHLDLTPLGRQEEDLPYPMAWVQRHDEYD
jgi:predicted dithiol-disulfide oxidoreductase (DUF899 family)